jgi:hypothetical protein
MWKKYFHIVKWWRIHKKASHSMTNAAMWRTPHEVRWWSSRPYFISNPQRKTCASKLKPHPLKAVTELTS